MATSSQVAACPCCILGVSCNADVNTLRRAFRARAAVLHPDKGDVVRLTNHYRDRVRALQTLSTITVTAAVEYQYNVSDLLLWQAA